MNFGKSKDAKALNENWSKPKNNQLFNFNFIRRYFDNIGVTSSFPIINDQTAEDLDFDELFKFLDRTTSKNGQQYFYNKLRRPSFDEKQLLEFNDRTELFRNNHQLRERIQLLLLKNSKHEAYNIEELIHGIKINRPLWFPLVYFLNILSTASLVLLFFTPSAVLIFLSVLFLNAFIHYWNKKNVAQYQSGAIALMNSIVITEKLNEIEQIRSRYDLSFLEEAKKLQNGLSYLNMERKLYNDLTAIAFTLSELFKIIFNIEILTTFRLAESLKDQNNVIHEIFKLLGEIDAAISVASLREGVEHYCLPQLDTSSEVEYKDLKHPLINDCVGNDLSLESKSVLLTGSNMSGKTTFIRTLAINTICAQTIYTCFAKTYKSSMRAIYSSVRTYDDLSDNKSYYQQELITMKRIIHASEKHKPCLIILDELFKGTNTIERIAAAKGVLSYLNQDENLVVAATHDVELARLLEDNFELFHFTEVVDNDSLIFDYKLKKGPLKTRNALKILELNDYPKEILHDANKTVEKLQALDPLCYPQKT